MEPENSVDRYDGLIGRARAGERILIDGATGTECLRRGVPELENGWSGGAALSHPEIVRQIHSEYIALGADLVASSTFASGRNVLADAGVEQHFESCNRRAVELAVEARSMAGESGARVVIAGGISNWSFSEDRPPLETLRDNTIEQARILRDAGAELLSLEMMVDMARMTATLDAAATVDLPIWVGFSIGPEEGHDADELGAEIELREGGLLAEAVRAAASYDRVDAICLMHSDVRLTERGVATIAENWDGPIGAYAHACELIDGEYVFDDVITPTDYASYEPAWREAGASMIGGCCGIGPDHLRILAAAIGS